MSYTFAPCLLARHRMRDPRLMLDQSAPRKERQVYPSHDGETHQGRPESGTSTSRPPPKRKTGTVQSMPAHACSFRPASCAAKGHRCAFRGIRQGQVGYGFQWSTGYSPIVSSKSLQNSSLADSNEQTPYFVLLAAWRFFRRFSFELMVPSDFEGGRQAHCGACFFFFPARVAVQVLPRVKGRKDLQPCHPVDSKRPGQGRVLLALAPLQGAITDHLNGTCFQAPLNCVVLKDS